MNHQATLDLGDSKVEIEYTDRLLDQVRQVYGMPPGEPVDPEIVMTYLEREIRSALSKVSDV